MSEIASLKDSREVALIIATRSEFEHIPAMALGRPPLNFPAVVVQDNTKMLAFTVDTDEVYYSWEIPEDYDSGDLILQVHWTNDGGVDDLNLDVKVQIDYQTYNQQGDAISGSHGNSPKTIEDTYLSATGWIIHTTENMTIAAADFAGKHIIAMKISFVTPAGSALTAEPHLIAFMITYTAKINA